jgi:hypothetical protein
MSYKLICGLLSLVPAAFAYYYYVRDVMASTTKPETFSWLIWGILAMNGFLGQISAHAGFGAWITGITALASLTVFCLAIYKGDSHPGLLDWTLLTMSLVGLVSIFLNHNKAFGLIITIGALIAGFVMTMRKAYRRPQEETAKSFFLNGVKFIPSIPALSVFSFATLAYPSVALVGNFCIAYLVWYRRIQISNQPQPALSKETNS